ncbi:GNAT family N-acetyltransferase [soil metagenome]
MEIIKASQKHVKELAAFSSSAFYAAYAYANTAEDMHQYISEHFSEEEIEKELSERNSYFFLAMNEGKISGYVKLGTATSPEKLHGKSAIEIERFYVDSELQSKRIGSELMKHILKFSKNIGKKIIWLGVWKNNTRAVSFYEREGFRKFGETIFTLGRDLQEDFLMKKEL